MRYWKLTLYCKLCKWEFNKSSFEKIYGDNDSVQKSKEKLQNRSRANTDILKI